MHAVIRTFIEALPALIPLGWWLYPPRQLTSLLRKIERHKEAIGKHRDALREIVDDLEATEDSIREAEDALSYAVDALSRYL